MFNREGAYSDSILYPLVYLEFGIYTVNIPNATPWFLTGNSNISGSYKSE